ncbi:MAG: polysaccharide pyruvyl transferase family protein [Saccharospirillum sp.]
MKVAIWGSYNHGNYGDDVMAVLYALTVKQLGYEPIVFRLSKSLAEIYQLKTTSDIDDLIDEVQFCILGGGAWLTTSGVPDAVEKDCNELLNALIKYQCDLYCVSIGGDGETNFNKLPKAHQNLFQSPYFKGGTVRLSTDLRILEKTQKNIRHYPDIIFNAANYLGDINRETPSQKKIRIGINLNKSQTRLEKILLLISKIDKDIEIIYVKSHTKDKELGFELSSPKNHTSKTIEYSDPKQFIRELSTLNCIISFKLHLGITALGMNIPFLSFGGLGKTQQQLREMGLNAYIVSYFGVFTFLIKQRFSQYLQKRIINNDINPDSFLADANMHLDYIKSLLNTNYNNPKQPVSSN